MEGFVSSLPYLRGPEVAKIVVNQTHQITAAVRLEGLCLIYER